MTVYTSTQATTNVRNELADAFGLPRQKVRVISEYVGGGFGSKLGVSFFAESNMANILIRPPTMTLIRPI